MESLIAIWLFLGDFIGKEIWFKDRKGRSVKSVSYIQMLIYNSDQSSHSLKSFKSVQHPVPVCVCRGSALRWMQLLVDEGLF